MGSPDEEQSWLEFAADTVPSAVAGLAVIVIVLLIVLIIVTRNVGHRIVGLNAMAQILGVWLVFVLLGGLALKRRHIQIDYFTDRLPAPLDRYHEVAVMLLSTAACVLFFLSAVAAAHNSLGATVPGPGIPLLAYFIAPVIGMGLITIVYLYRVGELLGIDERVSAVRTSEPEVGPDD